MAGGLKALTLALTLTLTLTLILAPTLTLMLRGGLLLLAPLKMSPLADWLEVQQQQQQCHR